MSDQHLIDARNSRHWVEHLEAANMTGHPDYRKWKTIETLSSHIDKLEAELHAVAEHSLAQGRKLREKEQQIDQVRKGSNLLGQLADDRQSDADQHSWVRDRSEGAAHAYTNAAKIIREALGEHR